MYRRHGAAAYRRDSLQLGFGFPVRFDPDRMYLDLEPIATQRSNLGNRISAAGVGAVTK